MPRGSEEGRSARSQTARITTVLALNVALIVALVVAGSISHSIGVLAAAGDTVADCLGLILGLVAIHLRDHDPGRPRAQRPIGIAALVNALLLLAVTVAVAVEAVGRLVAGSPAVHGLPVVIAGAVTVAVMLIAAAVLGRSAAAEDLHMRSVLLDALADAAAAAGVAVSGLVILLTERLFWLDSVIALVISAVIALAATRLVIKAGRALRGDDVDFDDD